MKLKNKIIISIMIIVLFMLVIPYIVGRMADAQSALGILLILLYVLNPLISIILGIIIGKDYKKIWYIPIIEVLLFLLFFYIVFGEVSIEYLTFVFIYLLSAYTSIIVTNLIQKKKTKK